MTMRLLFLNFTILLFLAGSFSNFAYADYEKGLKAYMGGNYAIALKEFMESANGGDARSQNYLGKMYYFGYGVPKNFAESVRWWRLAANQGYARSQNDLGKMYYFGYGVPKNFAESVRWWRLAANQGYAIAQSNLGVAYYLGQGVTQDDTEADHWIRLAADQGHVQAQYNLGSMYDSGEGILENDAEAVKWYRLAAHQWYARAQNRLGFMYENGYGVPVDNVLAYMWFDIANLSMPGSYSPVKKNKALRKKMTRSQRKEAKKLSKEWREKYYPLTFLQFPNTSPFPPGVELVLSARRIQPGNLIMEYIPEGEEIENNSQQVGFVVVQNIPGRNISFSEFIDGMKNVTNTSFQERCQIVDWSELDNGIVEWKLSQCGSKPTPTVSNENRGVEEHYLERNVSNQRDLFQILYAEKTGVMSDEMRQSVLDWLEGITLRQ